MAKSQLQRNREHVARLRKKAHAFDNLVAQLTTVALNQEAIKPHTIIELVFRAEKAVQERAE